MTVDNLKEIINTPELGPLHLETMYRQLKDNHSRNAFLADLEEIARHGTQKEKTAFFIVVEIIGRVKDFEQMIEDTVRTTTLDENETRIAALIRASATLSTNWSVIFIKRVIRHFKPQSGEYSYLFNMGLRGLISTSYWKDVHVEIEWALINYDDIYVIDLIAYFIWKQGEKELQVLLGILTAQSRLKVDEHKADIIKRYKESYQQLK